jgi:AcrR family transcriptional regulator
MPQTHLRRRAPAERREQLLSAGLDVLLQRGVKQATIEQITDAAGVAKGTFYLYFESKESFVAALQEQFAADMLHRAEVPLAQAKDGNRLSVAQAFMEEMIEFHLDRRHLQDIIYLQTAETPGIDATVAGSEAELFDRFTTLVVEGCKAGEFQVHDPVTTATLLLHAVHGGVIELFREENGSGTRLIAGVKELLHKSLLPESHTPTQVPPARGSAR